MTQASNIFGKGNEPYGNATIGATPNPWHLYAYGFRRAAEILIKHVEERHSSLDVIVFPTVFLFRHHLELAIKLLARDARLILDLLPPTKPQHGLRALWDEARSVVIRVDGVEPEGLDVIDTVVAGFDAIDSKSTTFRYPQTLDGANPLSQISNINLLALRDSLEPAFDMLDAAHDVMQMHLHG
ncbi:MAG: hypothetical protein WBP56_00240 [Polyangia bacterium]